MMELKDFVTETLVQIMEGANNAQERLKGTGALVTPRYFIGEKTQGTYYDANKKFCPQVEMVEFDVAVTSSESKENAGRAGVSVVGIQLGTKRTSESETSSVSRIKFQVPIMYKQNLLESKE